jgi:diacylglycerol kinase (ATP)
MACVKDTDERRAVRVLMNPKAGFASSLQSVIQAIGEHWDRPGIDLSFQLSRSIADGQEKTRRALGEGVDTIIVVGGDGMVNSIGSALVGSTVALGVIPTGSGNGFARHFGIPLKPELAAAELARAQRLRIDVGRANQRPFFVTCSMAWDAAIVRTFDKSPVRGILPYVFAAVYEFFDYERQPFDALVDGKEGYAFKDPLMFTVANLTQFGGQAQIAPDACPDDGLLELIVVERKDAPIVLANLPRLFNGTINQLTQVRTSKFHRLLVRRPRAAPIQMDGELVDAGPEIEVDMLPKALTVLVPSL